MSRVNPLEKCPSCGRHLQIAIHLMGTLVCCGHCQKKFRPTGDGNENSNARLDDKVDRLLGETGPSIQGNWNQQLTEPGVQKAPHGWSYGPGNHQDSSSIFPDQN